MSEIILRFSHHPTYTPIFELKVELTATVGKVRELVQAQMVSEPVCLMRVFWRWHAVMEIGSRRWLAEIKAEDEDKTVASLGLVDYSEVQLEGPLTGDLNGVGQAVALMDQRMREQSHSQTNAILHLTYCLNEMTVGQRQIVSALRLTHAQLLLQEAETDYRKLYGEAEQAHHDLLAKARKERQLLCYFSIDITTPHPGVAIEDKGTTAAMTAGSNVTLRAAQPLTLSNSRWAFRIRSGGGGVILGLLPKLSDQQVTQMDNSYVGDSNIGGWSIQNHCSGTKWGDWQCASLSFAAGDVVCFAFSFVDRTLTISCGGRQVVGYIRSIKDGDELYPAFRLCGPGERVSFAPLP